MPGFIFTTSDAGYSRCANGGYLRTASGAAMKCLCCSPTLACPAGTAANYTTSLPTSVSFGTCIDPGTCTPSITSLVLPVGSGCNWGDATGICVAGHMVHGVTLINGTNAVGCAAWILDVVFADAISGFARARYTKLRSGAAVVDVVGTYPLESFKSLTSGLSCGGSITASLTVSP